MKWYIYSEDNNNYTMILDHNISVGTTYNSLKTEGLEKLISTWDSSLKTRSITANEVAKITGNTSFDEKTSRADKYFYLDSNNQTQVANSTNKSKYAWLFDYTSGCKEYGCNIDHPVYLGYDVYGYWTSAPVAGETSRAWCVGRNSYLSSQPASYNFLGIRPVITISKSIIS